MLTRIVVTILILYHRTLSMIGKFIGMLTAGLVAGYIEGVTAVDDMAKYVAYRKRAEQLKKEKDSE